MCEMMESVKMKRRAILKSLAAALGAVLLWPARMARAGKLAIGLDKLDKLKDIGSSMTIKLKDRMVLFIRDGEDSVIGFDPTCTHQQCTVEHKAGSDKIECPCHGSIYDLEGKVLKGPAEDPLQRFETSLKDGRVVIDMGD
jgi:Rieske Fe-S protein